MRKYAALVLVVSFLCIGTISGSHASQGETVTTHDVKILGLPVNDTISGQPSMSATNCVVFNIGAPGGTGYPSSPGGNPVITISGADQTNTARIEAIEDGASCFNLSSSSRDRLRLVNTKIVVNDASLINQSVTIDYSTDFGSAPNGPTTFSGYMQGTFYKVVAGQPDAATSCPGLTGGLQCFASYSGIVVNNAAGSTLVPGVSVSNPTGPPVGSFTKTTPASAPLDMGQPPGNRRTHRPLFTVILPGTDYYLKISGTQQLMMMMHLGKAPFEKHGIKEPPPLGGPLKEEPPVKVPPGGPVKK